MLEAPMALLTDPKTPKATFVAAPKTEPATETPPSVSQPPEACISFRKVEIDVCQNFKHPSFNLFSCSKMFQVCLE